VSDRPAPVELSLAEQLWEIEQIKQLKARYFRFVDTRDWDAVTALFAPDCTMRSTVFEGVERPADFFARVAAMITPGVSVHHGHMPEITLTSPTTATGIWAMFDHVETEDRSVGYVGYGHYYETYARLADAGWLITSFELRRLRLDHTAPRPGHGPTTAEPLRS
jgi:SnoaL-like domain